MSDQPAPDLANEIAMLLRAGCEVNLRPLGDAASGVVVIELKITPSKNPLDDVIDYSGLPAAIPYLSQINLVALSSELPQALRKARKLFAVADYGN